MCGVFGKENLVICRSRGGGGEPCAYGGPAGWGSSIRLAFSRPTCHRTSIFIFRSRLVGRRYPASFRTPSGVFYNQLTSHWFAATTAPTDPFTDPSFQTCLCFHRSDYGILATGWSSPTLNRPLGDLSSATYHRFISNFPYHLSFAGIHFVIPFSKNCIGPHARLSIHIPMCTLRATLNCLVSSRRNIIYLSVCFHVYLVIDRSARSRVALD